MTETETIWIVMGLREDLDGSLSEYPQTAFKSEEAAKEELNNNIGEGRVFSMLLYGDEQ